MTCTCGHALPHRNTVEEALVILKLSRATLYQRISDGLLRVTKDGGRTFISGAELQRYMKACDATPQPRPAAGSTSEPASSG